MSAKDYREAFEEAVYKQYQIAEYEKFKAGNLQEFRLIPQQEFFKMKLDGTYKLDPVNFAYLGWGACMAFVMEESEKQLEDDNG